MRIHIVQPDESWAAIAERYGTTPEEIRAYNGVAEADLHPGMKLKVPPLRSAAEGKDLAPAEGSSARAFSDAGEEDSGEAPTSKDGAASLSGPSEHPAQVGGPEPSAPSAALGEAGAAARAGVAEGSEAAARSLAGSAYVPVGGGTYGMGAGFPGFAPLAGGWHAPGLWCVPAHFPGFLPPGWPPVPGGGVGFRPPTTWPTPTEYVPGSFPGGSPAAGSVSPPSVGIPSWRPPEAGARAFWEGIARTSTVFAGPAFDEVAAQGGAGEGEEDEAFPKMLWGGDVEEA
ncbi:MAG: LysM peptidoglycan-binding domain-containing protein [Brockia lithotrophica]|nr:LysM peptidoglycan-binding domain-containing protein [Brockia lithotrophica]